jgi:sensor histidine kinase regulating citrate/malate metabolism
VIKEVDPQLLTIPLATEVKSRFMQITQMLFDHPLWVQEPIQNEIATTNQDAVVNEIFKREGLDYIYITQL